MGSYHLWLTGTIYAESWDDALAEAERLRLTISNARDVNLSAPAPMAFQGTLNDGRSRPPGIQPGTLDSERADGFAKLGGYGGP